MEFRLANMSDLPKLKEIYGAIIRKMNVDGIEIWDDIYPCEFFAEDINSSRLHILTNEEGNILGAFALCDDNDGASHVQWENPLAKAMYVDRLGVNADFAKQGIGSLLLGFATKVAKNKSAEYLRLFVIDINKPAINLYLKNEFKRAIGVYTEVIDPTLSFAEYGFEKKV